MNKTILYMLGILAIIVFFAVGFFFKGSTPTTQTSTNNVLSENVFSSGNNNPFYGNTAAEHASSTDQIAISAAGGPANVDDFLKDPDVMQATSVPKDGSPSVTFYSLGSFPFGTGSYTTSSTTTLPSALDRGYEILYFPDTGGFSIFIYKEPIGEVRKKMAADLATRLGIPETGLCSTFAFVWVSPLANTRYAAKNVGFPGCSGAVLFPGD